MQAQRTAAQSQTHPGPVQIEIRGQNGQVKGTVLVDPADYEHVSQYRWHIVTSRTNSYARRWAGKNEDGKEIFVWMHRELVGLEAYDGTTEIDHEDGNGLNNQRSNLLLSDRKKNAQNRRKIAPASSKYRGVYWNKKASRWQANVKVNGKRIYLGLYDEEDEAGRAAREGRAKHLPHSTT